jgi:hypothetical protein
MFRNREDAALRLAAALKDRDLHDPLVLGIPRGGVVIGSVLARELGAELDVVLARKLRAPGQPELALGAVSESGQVYLNRAVEDNLWMRDYLAEEMRYQSAEIARRREVFRGGQPPAPISGRSVIVTDDGIATGSTMLAALRVVRKHHPRELIVAVPVAAADRLRQVQPWCDEVVCLLVPEWFSAIGQFYQDFTQVEDDEVLALLRKHGRLREEADARS